MQLGPFVLLPGSLVVNKHASIEEWEKAAKFLFMMQKHVSFYIGDMMRFAEAKFGDDAYQLIPEDVSENAMDRVIGVSKKIPERDREPTLSFTHHLMSLRIKDATLRRALLLRAATERLDTEQFGRVLKEALE